MHLKGSQSRKENRFFLRASSLCAITFIHRVFIDKKKQNNNEKIQ